jgi:hypothetical protein
VGLYWMVVNVTKKQRFELPNNKESGLIASAKRGMLAEVLIAWAGDEIRVLNDEGWREDLPDALEHPDMAMIQLFKDAQSWPEIGT